MVFTQSKNHKYRGDYPGAKKYANVALSLIIVNIIYVLGAAIFSIGMSLGLHYQYLCTRSYSCKLSLFVCISVIRIVTANIPKDLLPSRLLMRRKGVSMEFEIENSFVTDSVISFQSSLCWYVCTIRSLCKIMKLAKSCLFCTEKGPPRPKHCK